MAVDDLNRRIYASRPIGRVLSGHDDFEKESLDGHPAGPLAAVRRQRLTGGSIVVDPAKSFAARLERMATLSEPRKK